MKHYNIRFPVLLTVCTSVAVRNDQNEEDAIEAALKGFAGVHLAHDGSDFLDEEGCQVLRKVVQGNIFYGNIREAEAELESENAD